MSRHTLSQMQTCKWAWNCKCLHCAMEVAPPPLYAALSLPRHTCSLPEQKGPHIRLVVS